MRGRPIIRRASVIGLAFGGILLGHAVTYAGLTPGAVAREMLLAATGHGYLGAASRVGLLAVMAALAATLLGRLVGGRGDDPESASVTRRLISFQVSAFVALEIAERLGSGAPPSDLVVTLPLGIAIQVAVAMAIAAVIRMLLRAADRAHAWASTATPGRRDALSFVVRADRFFRPVLLPASVGGRAPPPSR